VFTGKLSFAHTKLGVMDFHWDRNCNMLFERGCHCSDELPSPGAIAQVLLSPNRVTCQVIWDVAARSRVKEFQTRPPENYNSLEEAITAVEITVREAGHTIDGV
jgi:hypothetical protein